MNKRKVAPTRSQVSTGEKASEGNRTLVTSLGSWGNAIIRRSPANR